MKALQPIYLCLLIISMINGACSSGDKSKPSASFYLDSNHIKQFDKINIIDESTGGNNITYLIEGGRYHIHQEVIRFLEPNHYTVTQVIINSQGEDRYSVEVDVDIPKSYYTLDNQQYTITTNAFWKTRSDGSKYVAILDQDSSQNHPNFIKLFPDLKNGALIGTYTYSDSGETDTYDLGFLYNYTGNNYDWTTNGDGGDVLSIELIYEDPLDDSYNAYDIYIELFHLNYGKWDFIGNQWVSAGHKTFTLSYRGIISQ